ncbi:MAG: hypothetical protein Q7N50_06105 [Armatimonadota bacterium]|nr:hypothetical protein [Armatimonadota bacterium]
MHKNKLDISIISRKSLRIGALVASMALALVLSLPQVPPQLLAQAKLTGARGLRTLWSKPVRPPVCITVTPDGRFTAVLAEDGSLTYYDETGRLLWRQDTDGARAVTLSGDGKILLTYTPLNPVKSQIKFWTSEGRVRWKQKLSNAIWSAAISHDGSTAVIGTGKKRVYIYTLNRGLRYRRRTLPGIPFSMALSPDNQKLIVGMWQESGVGVFTLKGKEIWRSKGSEDLQYTIQMSRNGNYILGMAQPNRPKPEATLGLWKSDGTRLLSKALNLNDVRAAISPTGDIVAVSYRQQIVHGKETMSERKLALYNRSGGKVWDREKGGVFFKPELHAVFSGNQILVSSDNTLYLLDTYGKMSKLKMPATIREVYGAPPSGKAIVYCGDGHIYMLDTSL